MQGRHMASLLGRERNKCEMIHGRSLKGIKGKVKGEAAKRIAEEFKREQVCLWEM